MHEPYTYLNGLTTTDLEDLLEDIKVISTGLRLYYHVTFPLACDVSDQARARTPLPVLRIRDVYAGS